MNRRSIETIVLPFMDGKSAIMLTQTTIGFQISNLIRNCKVTILSFNPRCLTMQQAEVLRLQGFDVQKPAQTIFYVKAIDVLEDILTLSLNPPSHSN